MSTIQRFTIAALILMPSAGCVKNPGSGGVSAVRGSATVATDALFEDEIGKANVMTAYEAVARLRPGMLRWRPGIHESHGADVYVDGLLLGGAEQLDAIPAAHIHAIRFVRSLEATALYRHAAPSGIILITTKLGPRGTRLGS